MTDSANATERRAADDDRPGRLGQVAAAVAIVAGVVFVVAVVFFSGFFLGGARVGYGGRDWPATGQFRSGGTPGTCPMMGGAG